jgi:hypothetical protein
MYSPFWLGLLICAIFGYRIVRLQPKHGVFIAIGGAVALFLIRETAVKRMIATGIADHNPPTEWLLTVYGTTFMWWSLAFLAFFWFGSRRRLKGAIDATPEPPTD